MGASQAKGGVRAQEEAKFNEAKAKKKKEQAEALLKSLFANAQNLKGVLEEEITSNQKLNLYLDPRNGKENMPETIITCLHFIEAVEDDKYGWRWECPQGGVNCKYRHQLPEGYVITSKKEREAQKKLDELNKENTQTMEEKIEEERAALPSEGLTPVTKESFLAWKERRKQKKQDDLEKEMKAAEDAKAKGKAAKGKNSIMSGRALFTYNPDLFKDDENAAAGDAYEEEESKVDSNLFAAEEVNEDEEVDFDDE